MNQPWMSGCGDWERRAIEVEGMEALKGKRREDLLGRVSALVENARQRVVGSLPWATKTGVGQSGTRGMAFQGFPMTHAPPKSSSQPSSCWSLSLRLPYPRNRTVTGK